jgi:16S rRNA (cytidine1402-2'-O)-methyltransferase
MNGELWLIGTPIGNLGDMTFRGVESLKAAGRIYAEDTRRTRALLSHFGIDGKSLLSLHAHSPERDIAAAIEMMTAGENVALVTDAGMPGISDPGSALVRASRASGLVVRVVPGPSAVTTAVALSGMIDGPFSFLGFLPRKGSKRRKLLSSIARSPMPTVLFEAPHRVSETMSDLCSACGPDRSVAICRELTKKFEETRVITLGDTQLDHFDLNLQGEFSLVVDRASEDALQGEELDLDEWAMTLLAQGLSVRDVSAQLQNEITRAGGKRSKREIYARVQELHADQFAELGPSPAEPHQDP